jgi:uncharacterized protein (DUF58 family)
MESAHPVRDFGFLRRLPKFLDHDSFGAWLRFVLAAIGLALAFAAAVFSTASRDAGNIPATVILASLALLIATAVGLWTVPYLTRRVEAKRVRDALDFEVTRPGAIYAAIVLVIGIAALNTGNNLLYIIVAMMLAAIAVSGMASALCLRGLELDLKIPEHIFAGTDVQATISVRNPRRWLPSLSVSAIPVDQRRLGKRWRWVATTFPVPPWRPPERQWLQLPDRKLRRVDLDEASGVFHETAYFPLLPPNARLQAEVKLRFRRRGRYQERFSLLTRFPFAFLSKTRRLALAREVLIYPELESSQELAELLPVLSGKREAYQRGMGSDLYRIREYLPEDSARHVDWKATAKSGALKVREFAREDERRLRVVFDNPRPGEVSRQAYEHMISLGASIAWHMAQEGVMLSFVSQEFEGTGDVFEFLTYLATVEPSAAPSLLETLAGSTDYSLVLTAQKRGTIPAAVWSTAYYVFIEQESSRPTESSRPS